MISAPALSPPVPISRASVQWSLPSVGPLELACRSVSLQHHHCPLRPLYRPRQPLLPTPPGYTTRLHHPATPPGLPEHNGTELIAVEVRRSNV
ncbi:hypothetical protein VZT92_026428 [Zoarces viviparus]|uniref:Uncharacterized protein n=1 Tax=Zoarces viviparus TaxID=48416 RepID=A0AAW1E077_ZOAVI